ncbi:MAG TPA: MlaD family protein [Steroidobacteraceae bacterium]
MSEANRPGVDELPAAVPSKSRFAGIPLVWILPIVVVFAAGFVVVHEKLAQGVSIEITFQNAEGLEANKTQIRYKEVIIGEVRDISVSKDRKHVIVKAQINRASKDYMVVDTRFWVVRPRVSAAGVTGLGTLVSGEYISADVGNSTVQTDHFVGLETPPVLTSDLPGHGYVLHAEDLGSLSIGSQVFYRHLEAGQVVGYSLDPGGAGVTIKVFINSPFDGYINGATRFWQASGVDMSVTSDGVKLHTESLTSILEGGIAFQSLPGLATTPVPANTAFSLYPDEDRAMRPTETEIRSFVMYFGGSLRGLSSGAPVELHGINIGEVKSVDVEYDSSSGTLRFPVVVELYPQRIRGKAGRDNKPKVRTSETESRRLLDTLVTHGLRAELKTGNLLTGQKLVVLDMHPGALADSVDWDENPAIFPTIAGGLDEIQDSVGNIAKSLSKVRFDQLSFRLENALATLDTTLKNANQLLQNVNQDLAPQVKATFDEAREAMKNAKDLLSQDAPLQSDLGSTLLQVSRAAKSISALVDYLQRHPESLLRGKPGDPP